MSVIKAAWTNEDNFSIETTASDYIKREDVIKANENYVPYQRLGEDRQSYMDRILKDLPSADVVEVVRCKDCKWAGRDEHCPAIEMCMICGGNGYCSYGERE